MVAQSSASVFVPASPRTVWAAFTEPRRLLQWLPPAPMRGEIHRWEGWAGGGYEMSLHYPQGEPGSPGKTEALEDRVVVRFTEMHAPQRLVEAVAFVTDDPSLKGEMIITTTIEPAPGGSTVTMDFDNLPPGLKPEDNDEGARISLNQLAKVLGGE
jgi:uncharacterized protein YndB with AHSA1/START domain